MPIKVSVVVPAYQPGDGLARVVESLDKQSLPQDEFEVIIIDDGSPDDTFARLQKISASRPNYRIDRIENSGWPSRPRNIGIDLARGEYVLFMDHDDFIYRDGLRSSFEFAKENNADVLSPKESKTTDVGWGITNFTRNVDNARDSHGIDALFPMMPHKFYRREFLLEHRIRFPEGRRMLWEDIYFNVQAYRHASVISILSETPVYRWVETKSNNSATYGPGDQEFWEKLSRLFEFVSAELAGEEFRKARESTLVHLYSSRVLSRLYRELDELADGDLRAAADNAQRLVEEYIPEEFDARLGMVIRARAFLLRNDRLDLLRELHDAEADIAGITHTERVQWQRGALEIDTVTRWVDAAGEPLLFTERGGRLMRRLPAPLAQALPEELLDVTEAVQRATTDLTVRSRDEYATWMNSTSHEVELQRGDDETVEMVVRASTRVDIDHAAFGHPLTEPIYDFHARNTLLGTLNHRALRTDTTPQSALIIGRVATAYRNTNGMLSLDTAQQLRCIVTDGGAATERATFSPLSRGLTMFTLPLDDVHVAGTTKIAGEISFMLIGGEIARILLSHRVARIPKVGALVARAFGGKPAVLESTSQGSAQVSGVFRALPGTYTLISKFGHRTASTPVRLHVSLGSRRLSKG